MPFAERFAVRIHYRDEGVGFPLVLHTGGAGDGTMWDGAGYTRRLDGYRLLVMDHRGRLPVRGRPPGPGWRACRDRRRRRPAG